MTMLRTTALVAIMLVLPVGAAAEPTVARQAELKHLLEQDCGSCHGMTLQGGLGPALTPERMGAFPVEVLQAVILDGRPGTPMPPWRGILKDDEAAWLAGRLRQGGGP
jgi:cytochrome c55X